MKLVKSIRKIIVVLLCVSMVMTNILPSFADGNIGELILQEMNSEDFEETIESETEIEPETEMQEIEEEYSEEPEDDFPEAIEETEVTEEVLEVEENDTEDFDLVETESDVIEEISEAVTEETTEVVTEETTDIVLEENNEETEKIVEEVESTTAIEIENASEASPSDIAEESVDAEAIIENDEEISTPSELGTALFANSILFGASEPEVWKIGDKGYKSLQDALHAATDGCTIEPGADYDTNDTITVPSNDMAAKDTYCGIYIPYSADSREYTRIAYTIDFKGKPLKVNINELEDFDHHRRIIYKDSDQTVKLKGINGVELNFAPELDKTIKGLIYIGGYGGIEIEDCTFEYGDEVESLFFGGYCGKAVIGDGNIINIPRKVADGGLSFAVTENSTSEITVTDGDCFNIGDSPCRIQGGTFTVQNGSFIHGDGQVELSNANVTVKGNPEENALFNSEGNTNIGAVISSGTYNLEEVNFIQGGGNITIYGGKYKFKKLDGVNFDLKGGLYKYTGDPIVINESTTLTTTEDVISYYFNPYYYAFGCGLYSMESSSDPDYDVEVVEKETYPWKIGDVKYTSLQKAVDAATDGCVIEPCDADSEDDYNDYDEKGTFIITQDNAFVTIDNDVDFTIDFKNKPMNIKFDGIFIGDEIYYQRRLDEVWTCAIQKNGTNNVTIKNIYQVNYTNETTTLNVGFPVFRVLGRLEVVDCDFSPTTGGIERGLLGPIYCVGDEGDLSCLRINGDNLDRVADIYGGKTEIIAGLLSSAAPFVVKSGKLILDHGVYTCWGNSSFIEQTYAGDEGGDVEIKDLTIKKNQMYAWSQESTFTAVRFDFLRRKKDQENIRTVKFINVGTIGIDNFILVSHYNNSDEEKTLCAVEVEGGEYSFTKNIIEHIDIYGHPDDEKTGGVEVILKGGNYRYDGTDGATTQEKVAPYVAEGYATKSLPTTWQENYDIAVVNDERKWKIGENTYRTLQEAVDEVASGSIIERITTANNEAFLVSPGGVAVDINGKEDFTIDFKNDPLLIYLNYNLENEWQYFSDTPNTNIVHLLDSKNVTIKNINKIKFDTTSPNYQELFRWGLEFPEDNPHYGMGMTRNKPLLHALIFDNQNAKLEIEDCDFTYGDEEINNLYCLDQRKGGVSFLISGGETIIGNNNTIVSGIELARMWGGKFTVKEGSNSTFVSTNKGFFIGDEDAEVEIGGGKYTLTASAINGYGHYSYQSLAFLDFEDSCGAATISNAEVNVDVKSDIANSLVEFDFSFGTPTLGKTVTFTSGTYNIPGKLVYNKTPEKAASYAVKITGGKYTFGNDYEEEDDDENIKMIIEGGSFKQGWSGQTEDAISPYVPTGYMIQNPSLESGYDVDVVKAEYVCKVATNKYYTIQEAIDAVTENGTIDIINNVFDNTQISIKDKKFTINFNDGTTQYSFKNLNGTNKEYIFLIENSEVTVNDFKYIIGPNVKGNTIFKVKNDSKLTLNNTICDSADNIADTIVYNDGGEVIIDGGTFGTNADVIMNLTNNATLKLTNNPIFKCKGNIINIGATSNTDPDTLAANVTIDNGIFNSSSKAGLVALYAKANVTINDATFTSSNVNSALIYIGNGGYKSNVVIKNITCESPYIFRSSNNANIESFAATVNNGHFKYTKGQFAIDSSSELKPAIKLNGGYFGPNTVDDDTLAELTLICPTRKKVEVLATEDSEYANGYRYKVVNVSSLSSSRSSGSSSGGGGGGGGGGSLADPTTAISPATAMDTAVPTDPATITTYYDTNSAPNLLGPISVSSWTSDVANSQSADIHYAQNTDSFVHSDNTPVVKDWVGVTVEGSSKPSWYRTDETGKILKNQFVTLNDNIYYFDINGVMVTGRFVIGDIECVFDTTPGNQEGKLICVVPGISS